MADGGSAFPQYVGMDENGDTVWGEGMSLRDFFAAHALQGLLANAQIAKDMVKDKIGPELNQSWHGETAYAFADALLKARSK